MDKGQLELTKECEESGARLKDAKKKLFSACECKVVLFFCGNTCQGLSDHFAACKEKIELGIFNVEDLKDQGSQHG